jgi:RecA/RadA recombinase
MKSPLRMTLVTLALLPLVALAEPPPEEAQREAERTERMEKRRRMMQVVGLAEELELEPGQAVKLADTMRQFDERRQPLREQVRQAAETLQRAAEGDTAVQGQVDAAVQRAFDARAQLAALDREMYQAMAKELPAQKRAQLALFLARFEGKLLKMKHKSEGRRQKLKEKMKLRMLREHGVQP